LNLLSNAVKCNRDGGSVQLSCEPVAGERLRIKVTDTGLGISPEALGRLFVPFERVAREQSAIEGTGLGLPLSKRLADPDRPLHRGQPVQPSAGRAGPEPPAGVRLISAMRPQLGLDLAGEHDPDLVLLDLHLPDMPRETVLRRLQANPRTAGIPVVILSADARPG
jgi:CheY-like chemotaxis protein